MGKRKYIPNLAEFYFKPDFDWSVEEAKHLYFQSASNLKDIILYEDCIQGMKKLSSENFDLILADPPFGLSFDGKEAIYNRKSEFVVEGYNEIEVKDYNQFSHNWISEIPRLLKPQGSIYIFSGWTNLLSILQAIKDSGLILRNHLIWNYSFPVFTTRKFATSHYHILYCIKDEKKVFFNRIQHYETDTWIIPRKYNPRQLKNGTKLPLEIVRKCINYSTQPGDLVLDPFTGNATTQVAAKGEFRHFLGFENNQKLKELIEMNIAQVNPGEYYLPYFERLPTLEDLKKKYPKSYKKYQEHPISEKKSEKDTI